MFPCPPPKLTISPTLSIIDRRKQEADGFLFLVLAGEGGLAYNGEK